MAKSSGTTKYVGSGAASESRLGQGKGIASSNTFNPNTKISSFEGYEALNGGYFSLMTKNGKYTMIIETTNGDNEEFGTYGTLIEVGIMKGTGSVERLATSFVESDEVPKSLESMGIVSYINSATVAKRINGSMPYYAELANNWIKKNK
jgi:hypothetical protein